MTRTMLNILLIEDTKDYAELVKLWLTGRKDVAFTVEWSQSLKAGVSRLAKGGVDAVLLDLGLEDSRPDQTLPAIKAAASTVPIVILSGGDAEPLALKMVEQGAQDYVVKNSCNSELLVKTLQFAVGRSRQKGAPAGANRGRVIAVMGAKGGVGATTVALNVAAVLARRGKVNLVEMSPGFGTLMPCLRPQGVTRNLSQLLNSESEAGPEEIAACLWACQSVPGLRVLFGPQTADECAELDPEKAASVTQSLAGLAEFVVVDLPPSLSAANRAVVERSQSLALVLEREPVCVHQASRMARALESWPGCPQLFGAAVVNRVSFGNPMPMAEVENLLGCRLLGVVPPVADLCLNAHKAGKALVTLDPSSLAAGSLTALADLLAPAEAPARATPLERVRR